MDTKQKTLMQISKWGIQGLAGFTGAASLGSLILACMVSSAHSNSITSWMIMLLVFILLLCILLLALGRLQPNLDGKNTMKTVLGGSLSAILLVLSIGLLVLGGLVQATGDEFSDHAGDSDDCVESVYLQPMSHVYAILSEECPNGIDDCPCYEAGDCLSELSIETKILKKIEKSMNCSGICSQFERDNETCEESMAEEMAIKTKLISAFAITTGSVLLLIGIALGVLTFALFTNFFAQKQEQAQELKMENSNQENVEVPQNGENLHFVTPIQQDQPEIRGSSLEIMSPIIRPQPVESRRKNQKNIDTERTDAPNEEQNTTLKDEMDIDDASDNEGDSPDPPENPNATQLTLKSTSTINPAQYADS